MSEMRNHWFSTEKRFVVPPQNRVHIAVSGHSNGQFYVATHRYLGDGVWSPGEIFPSGFPSENLAMIQAEELWLKEKIKGE